MIKRIAITFIAVLILTDVFAQEIVNKRGVPVLPKPGDWSIGFDVVPILRKAGALFHETDAADLTTDFPFTVNGRYCKSEKTTYRASFSLNFTSTKTDTLVPKQGSTNPNEQVADETTKNAGFYQASFGVQRWIGKSRVRGFFGGEAGESLKTGVTKYSFGNPLGAQNPVQTYTVRVKDGTENTFFLRGFFGVEVYIAPKIALSAEYGFSPLMISTTSANEIETDSWDGSAVKTEIKTTKGKATTVGLVTDDGNGAISLLFYF